MTSAYPLPDLAFEPTRGFFEAAARGELAIPRCGACGRYVWYPAPACRRCGAGDPAWTRVSGRGTLFSWARVLRTLHQPYAALVPYVSGLVALAEDPAVRLVTLVVDCRPEDLRVDLPVRAVFRALPAPVGVRAPVAPMFTPAR